LSDLGLVNAQLAQSVTASNYLKDVNASGTLTLADKGITNANLAKALPLPNRVQAPTRAPGLGGPRPNVWRVLALIRVFP
jgi:hypothetical protein